jgi:tetratricopeptide (TPR) repeat protein
MSEWFDAEAHADRALQMYERGRWAEAEAELRKALSLNPDQAEWHFNLGLTLEQAGRDVEALPCYLRTIELMPEQPEPLVAAGVVSNRLGQYEQAISLFDQALKMESQLEEAYAHRIESHVRLGNHEEAETCFYLAQHALENPSAQCLAAMAESLIERAEYQRADWCLKEALRIEPNLPRLRARLATVFAATGKPQRALQLYLRELRDDPGNIDTLLEFGDLLISINRLPEAGEKFRRVLELEPAHIEAHHALGRIALQTGRFEQAHLEFELVLKLDPQFSAIRQSLGETLLRRGRIDEARRYLVEEFEALTSADAALPGKQPVVDLAALATLLLECDEPCKAAQLLETSLQQHGDNVDALRQLALARFGCGDRLGGAAASRRVLRLDPACVRSIHNLALAAMQENQLRMAAGWVKRGLKLKPHDDGLRRLRIRVWISQSARWITCLVRRPFSKLNGKLKL